MNWISVKDRLPDQCWKVIILYDTDKISIGYWDKCLYRCAPGAQLEEKIVWGLADNCCESEVADEVTHWIPLPKTPDEEK